MLNLELLKYKDEFYEYNFLDYLSQYLKAISNKNKLYCFSVDVKYVDNDKNIREFTYNCTDETAARIPLKLRMESYLDFNAKHLKSLKRQLLMKNNPAKTILDTLDET